MKKLAIISLAGAAVTLLACNSGGSTSPNAKYTVSGIAGANPIVQTAATKCSFKDTTVTCNVESAATAVSNLTVAANVTPNGFFVKPTNLPDGLSITYSGGQTPSNHIEGNLAIECKQADMKGAATAKYTIELDGDSGKMNYITVQCNNTAAGK